MMLYRKQTIIAAIIVAALTLAGCGGGGGGGSQSSSVVVTGRIVNYQDQTKGVPNATVTLSTYSDQTDANGNFSIEMPELVVNPTFSVTPPTGFYSAWALYNSEGVSPSAIPTPLPLYDGKNLGTVYLWDLSGGGPPPPPSW